MRRLPRRRSVAWLLLPALFLLAGALGANPLARADAQAIGTVTVTKALQNSAGQPVQGDLSGYVFVLTGGGQSFTMAPTLAMGGQTTLGVPAGNYTITEQPRAGSTLVDFRIGGAPIGGFTVTVGQTVAITATNQVSGAARVDITKRIVDASGTLLAVQPTDLSGFQFTLTGPGGFSQTVTTDVTGAASVTNLGTGTYSITEQPRSGYAISSLVVNNAVSSTNSAQFFVGSTGTTTVQAFNRIGAATGSVLVTKQIVDANNNPVPNADRSGFGFTIQCGSGSTAVTRTGTTDASGTVTITDVPAGACVITEQSRPGFTPISMTIQTGTTLSATSGTPVQMGGAITVVAGQTLSILAVNRQAAQTETINLVPGCNNQSLTWPNGTSTGTVVQAVSPSTAVVAIWKFDASAGRFLGYSTIVGAPNDLLSVNRLDAVFICLNAPATLTRPAV